VVNQFYVHCVDEGFDAFFLKFSSYFPHGAKLLINGHHYAQAQAARAGIEHMQSDTRGGDGRRSAPQLGPPHRGEGGPQPASAGCGMCARHAVGGWQQHDRA